MTAPVHVARAGRTRRRNRSGQFLRQTAPSRIDVNGVTLVGASGEWSLDPTGYRVSYHENERRADSFWWLHGPDIDPVETTDPYDAVDLLRRRGLIAGGVS